MKSFNFWYQSFLSLMLIFMAVGSGKIAATANPLLPNPATSGDSWQTAQGTNLCRRVVEQRGLVIHERPTPNSPSVGGVGYNQDVQLIPGYTGIRGPDGRTWLEISFPTRGFIANGVPTGPSNLVLCSGSTATPPPTNDNLCRLVDSRATSGRGLVVRATPSTRSAQVGGVPANSRVSLVPNYRVVPDANGESRTWVEIAAPLRGFISAGNLVMCR